MNALLQTGKVLKEIVSGKIQIFCFKKKDLKDSRQAGHLMQDLVSVLSIIYKLLKL